MICFLNKIILKLYIMIVKKCIIKYIDEVSFNDEVDILDIQRVSYFLKIYNILDELEFDSIININKEINKYRRDNYEKIFKKTNT